MGEEGQGKEAKVSFSANALMEKPKRPAGRRQDRRGRTSRGDVGRHRKDRELAGRLAPDHDGWRQGVRRPAFIDACRSRNITPHVAQTSARSGGSRIDTRTTRHPGYVISQRKRQLVEEIFGWMKTIGGFRKRRFHGVQRTWLAAYFVGAAYNLLRMD
jgi:hypothetical protein